MSYVGNVKKGTATHLVGSTLYGTCGTASGTVAKVGTLSNFDALLTGVTVHLKMTNSNTASAPTLNVNGTGAKPIVRYGTTAVGTTATTSWYAGSVVSFTYDGTSWVVNDYYRYAFLIAILHLNKAVFLKQGEKLFCIMCNFLYLLE